jgi:poly(ADP-ribose) glycohydrolase
VAGNVKDWKQLNSVMCTTSEREPCSDDDEEDVTDVEGIRTAVDEMGAEDAFFGELFPWIAKHALEIETLFPDEHTLPLLVAGAENHVTIPRQSAACLLANAFFGTHVEQEFAEDSQILAFHFWFGTPECEEKIKCILNYFHRCSENMPQGELMFYRRVVEKPLAPQDWQQSSALLQPFELSEGGIEQGGEGMLQVDFANEYIGGGVLQDGNVQVVVIP